LYPFSEFKPSVTLRLLRENKFMQDNNETPKKNSTTNATQDYPSPLPKLIFSETHADTTTIEILFKLLPKLKQLGYNLFYDEQPRTYSRESLIKSMKDGIKEYDLLNLKFHNYGFKMNLNEASEIDLKKFMFLIMVKNGRHTVQYLNSVTPSEEMGVPFPILVHDMPSLQENEAETIFKTIRNDVYCIARCRESKIANIKLYETLPIQGISYVCIDLKDRSQRPNDPGRDIAMGEAYTRELTPVFGRVGQNHVRGIQNTILKEISKEKAGIIFSFFHIWSDEKYEKDTGWEKECPLDIIKIDAKKQTYDDIVNSVVKHVMEKKVLIENFQKREQEDSSFRIASAVGDLEVVKKLLSNNVNVNSCDNLSRTALHYVVMRIELVKNLLKNKNLSLSVNLEQRPQVFKLLIENNADINLPNSNGNTPLGLLERDSNNKNIDGQQAGEMLKIYQEHTKTAKVVNQF
jgi:hypothetical protein